MDNELTSNPAKLSIKNNGVLTFSFYRFLPMPVLAIALALNVQINKYINEKYQKPT